MAVGDLGKQAISMCKSVYAGMNGKYGGYAAKVGEKIIDSNMTASQKQRVATRMKNAAEKGVRHNGSRIYGDKAAKIAGDKVKNKIATANSIPYKFGDAVGGGIRDTVKSFNKIGAGTEGRIAKSLDAGFKRNVLDEAGKVVKNEKGEIARELNIGRIAGTAFGVGVAGRVVTGGGLYRDKNGNANLPGIPFI